MDIDLSDLKTVGMVINEPGFKIVEALIREAIDGENDLMRVVGEPFKDGMSRGHVEGRVMDLALFRDLRQKLSKMGDG